MEEHKTTHWSSSLAEALSALTLPSETRGQRSLAAGAGRWTSAQCWGTPLEKPAQLVAQTGKRASWLCSGGRHSEQCQGLKTTEWGQGLELGYSTLSVPVQFTPVPQRKSPEHILVYTFKFISPSFWRLLSFQELL